MNPQPPAAPSQILPSTIGEEYYVGAAIGINPDTGRAVPISYPCASNIRFVGWCEKRITGDGVRTVSCRVDQSYKPQAQPPAAPITPEEVQALRDALAKATPGEWVSAWDTDKKPQPIEPESSLGESWVIRSTSTDLTADKDGLVVSTMYYDGLWAACTAEDARAIVAAYNLAPKLLAALDAAEAQAVEFAWDTLAFASVDPAAISTNTDYSVYQCLTTASVKAAEYLAERKLLKRTGERMWQRVEGGK